MVETETKPVIRTMRLTEDELAQLIATLPVRTPIQMGFGPSGAWLQWDESRPMPAAVKLLRMMRGIDNENTDGDGV